MYIDLDILWRQWLILRILGKSTWNGGIQGFYLKAAPISNMMLGGLAWWRLEWHLQMLPCGIPIHACLITWWVAWRGCSLSGSGVFFQKAQGFTVVSCWWTWKSSGSSRHRREATAATEASQGSRKKAISFKQVQKKTKNSAVGSHGFRIPWLSVDEVDDQSGGAGRNISSNFWRGELF